MNAQQVKAAIEGSPGYHATMKTAAEMSKLVVSISAALAVMFGLLWWFVSPRVEPYTNLPEAVSTLSVGITEMSEAIAEQGEKIITIEKKVATIAAPEVVEWDQFRSRIVGKACRRGQTCTAELWVRRTPEGTSCGTPTISRSIRDSSGAILAARDPNPGQPITRAQSDWLVIEHKFLVPEIAAPGEAVYYLDLLYPECAFAEPGQEVEGNSPPLDFVIE